MPADLKVKIKRFLGIDNINESNKVPLGTLSTATNVDIRNDLSLSRRRGYVKKTTGDFHSLWSNGKIALAVKDDKLVRVFPDYSTLSLGNYPGVSSGIVCVDGKDGFVYCAGYGFMIRIADNGTIYTPEKPDAVELSSYSPPIINNYDVTDSGLVQGSLTTKRNKTVIEAATVLEVYKGRMYAALDNILWLSDAYDFMRMLKVEKNYLYFPGDITAIRAVDNGVYVSEGDKVWFLSGTSPDNFVFTVAYDAEILRGSDVRVDDIVLGEQTISPAIIWTTKKGICVGTDGGQVINLTEDKYDMPNFITGSAIFRKEGGLDRYLAVFKS
jgi:hypothetical protein